MEHRPHGCVLSVDEAPIKVELSTDARYLNGRDADYSAEKNFS
jgi:hypothetical protein